MFGTNGQHQREVPRQSPAPGLGVPCREAQADGVPCMQLRADCADCDKANPEDVGANRKPSPPPYA